MSTTLTRDHVLRIYHGAGNVYEIPASAVAGSRGPALACLRRIVAENIHDNDLLETLNNGKVVLQAFTEEEGELCQEPVSPEADFARFAALLNERTVALSASVRHEGGL